MSQTIVKEGYDQSPPGAAKAPGRETPDFAALAKLFSDWDATELEVLWEHNEEIATLAQFKYFLTFAKNNELEPLRDEVVAAVRWNPVKRRQEMTPLVTIGVFRKRRATECDGIDPFEFEEDSKTKLPIAASGKIYRKEAKNPFCAKVWFSEYAPIGNDGFIVPLWANKGHMMLGKVLEAQLTRIGFYDLIGDVLIDEETQRNAAEMSVPKPAEDEYAVGVKPDATETKPAEAETKPQVNGAPAPPAETKSPGQKAGDKFWEGKEQATDALEIKFGIRQVVVVEGKQELRPVDDPPQSHKDSAVLSARAMANAKVQPFVVVALKDGKIDMSVGDEGVVAVCNPLPPEKKPKPRSVTHAEAARATVPPANTLENTSSAAPANTATGTTSAPPATSLAAVAAAATPDFDFMIAAISTATGEATKEAYKLIGRYLGAYLNIPRNQPTPKDRPTLLPGIQALYGCWHAARLFEASNPGLTGYPAIEELKANPEALGIRLSGRKDRLDEEFNALNWPVSVRELARKVMEKQGKPAEEFIEWIKNPCAGNEQAGTAMSITEMDVAALEIFFPLFLLVGGRTFEVADWALANGQNVTHIYQELVKASKTPLEKWTPKLAATALDLMKESAATDLAPKPEAKDAAPPVDDVDAWAKAGLPFED